MARRSMAGQLNMFDFYSSMDAPGEVEMVSLVPDFDEEPEPEVEELPQVEEVPEIVVEPKIEKVPEIVVEPEVEGEPAPKKDSKTEVFDKDKVAMSRSYEIGGNRIEIAYIGYNKVRITHGDEAPVVKEFASSKEAVDYYVEQMQGFMED